jgi:hypothetical protein
MLIAPTAPPTPTVTPAPIALPQALAAQLQGAVAVIVGFPDALAGGGAVPVDAATAFVRPALINDRLFVPVRFFVEAFGGEVAWDAAAQVGDCRVLGKSVRFSLGSADLTVDGAARAMGSVPRTSFGRAMLPLRPLCDALGLSLHWDAAHSLAVASPSPAALGAEDAAALAAALTG